MQTRSSVTQTLTLSEAREEATGLAFKRNQTEDANWPENVNNVQICYLHASFDCCVNIYPKEDHFCFVHNELQRVQHCRFAVYQWRAEKYWLVKYLILLPHMPASFMTSLMQMTMHKMSALPFVFLHLSNGDNHVDKQDKNLLKNCCILLFVHQSNSSSPLIILCIFCTHYHDYALILVCCVQTWYRLVEKKEEKN